MVVDIIDHANELIPQSNYFLSVFGFSLISFLLDSLIHRERFPLVALLFDFIIGVKMLLSYTVHVCPVFLWVLGFTCTRFSLIDEVVNCFLIEEVPGRILLTQPLHILLELGVGLHVVNVLPVLRIVHEVTANISILKVSLTFSIHFHQALVTSHDGLRRPSGCCRLQFGIQCRQIVNCKRT